LHSEDEIIHVLDGELLVGPLVIGPGTSIAIPAERRYSFRTRAGFRFVNYRPTSRARLAPREASRS
jgi:hypothetical protein